MTSEKSVNVDEITSINKIKLVVTDAHTDSPDVAQSTDVAKSDHLANSDNAPKSANVAETTAQTRISSPVPAGAEKLASQPDPAEQIANPDKLLRELPVDEFFRVLEQATPEQLQTLIHTFERGARTRGGAAILNKVIEVPAEPRNLISILSWWEWRRPLYNLVVSLSGLPSVIVLSLCFGLPPVLTIMSGLCYLFFANLCYSLGTPAEMVARTCYKDKAETYGPVLLTLGTIFSVILTITLELIVVGFMFLGALH